MDSMPFRAARTFLRERWPFVAAIVLVVALRNVDSWTAPRFWGEEADLFYAAAKSGSLLEAVFGCPQGYYNLGCRAGTLLALLLPVEHAPLATTAFALCVQVLPALLVLRLAHRGGWNHFATAAACAAMVLAPPLHETWLTSTGSSFYLVLAGALVVLYGEELALGRLAALLALAAGLSSGYSIGLVLPGVWLALQRQRRGDRTVLAALCAGVGVQVLVFLFTGLAFDRGSGLGADTALAAFAVKCFVLPVAGLHAADQVGAHLLWYMHTGTFWRWAPLLLLPVALLWFVVLRSGSRAAVAALVCGHTFAVTAMVGGLGDKHGMVSGEALGRYFVPVNALHLLAAIEALRTGGRSWIRLPLLVLLIGGLVQGVIQYFDRPPLYFEGPDWRTEVRAWRSDPSHPMATWPRVEPPSWFVRLPPP